MSIIEPTTRATTKPSRSVMGGAPNIQRTVAINAMHPAHVEPANIKKHLSINSIEILKLISNLKPKHQLYPTVQTIIQLPSSDCFFQIASSPVLCQVCHKALQELLHVDDVWVERASWMRKTKPIAFDTVLVELEDQLEEPIQPNEEVRDGGRPS